MVFFETIIAGNANDVLHTVSVTPVEHPVAAETAVTPEDNLYVWPLPSQGFDQQGENGPAVLGGILAAVSQVAHQQVPPTEDIERHKAIAVVVAVEEALLLLAVHRDIRSIEVQNQALVWFLVAGNELVKEQFMEIGRHRAILLLLKTTQGSGTGERSQALTAGLKRTIEAQLVGKRSFYGVIDPAIDI